MATQYVAGGRRSAAPQLSIPTPQGTAVSNIMRAFTQPAAAPAPAVAVPTPVQPRSGSYNTASISGAPQASFNGTTNPMNAVRTIQALAMLGGNPEAAKLAGTIGTVGQIATANNPVQAGMAVAPVVAQKLGIPGGVLGLGMAAVKGDLGMGVDAGLSLANPMLGAVNALTRAITGTSLGTAVSNIKQDYSLGQSVLGTDAGMLDSYKAGNEINTSPDPIGALIGALSAKDATESDNFGGGYGVRGGSGFSGGYGGGIGQSGGNAAGMGSTQA